MPAVVTPGDHEQDKEDPDEQVERGLRGPDEQGPGHSSRLSAIVVRIRRMQVQPSSPVQPRSYAHAGDHQRAACDEREEEAGRHVRIMSPLPCLCPRPYHGATLGVQDGGGHALPVTPVAPAVCHARQVAALAWCVGQVDVPACHGQRPVRHRLVAVGAQVTRLVLLEAAGALGLVCRAVAALRGGAGPPDTRGHRVRRLAVRRSRRRR